MPEKDILMKAAPAYLKIELALKHRINDGEFLPGEPLLTEREICEKFHVSRITARRVLDDLEQEGCIDRIQGKGSFVRKRTKKKNSNRKKIAFVANGIFETGTLPVILGACEKIAHEKGYQITYQNTEGSFDKFQEIGDRLNNWGFDGVILDPLQSDDEYEQNRALVDSLEENGIPVVLIQNHFMKHPGEYSYVASDNYRGAHDLVRHLIDIGHKRIGVIHSSFDSANFARVQGYRSALLDDNLSVDTSLIREIADLDCIPEILDYFLGLEENVPSAIFCEHDLIASDCIRVLRERSISVPDDIAIVGFDDLQVASLLNPTLTTVAQQLDEIGTRAMNLLSHRIEENTDDKVQTILPCKLVIRESCGAGVSVL